MYIQAKIINLNRILKKNVQIAQRKRLQTNKNREQTENKMANQNPNISVVKICEMQ